LPAPGALLGALDLFVFCFLVIFGNVLDFRTYTNARGESLEDPSEYDQNGIALEERVNMRQARGVCLELLRWWNTKYTAEDHSMEGGFTTHLLMNQAVALLNYKERVEQDNREGAPGCTLFMLTQQIENVLSSILPDETPRSALRTWKTVQDNLPIKDNCKLGFQIEDWNHINIAERQPPQHYGKHYSADGGPDAITPSQRCPRTFFPLVLRCLTRQPWITQVLWCRRCTKTSALNTKSDKMSQLSY
jgi:hypothetical protein